MINVAAVVMHDGGVDVHLRDLRYFVAVADELDLGRAARRLLVAEPVLSRQITRLEHELRVALLDRGSPLTLTEPGQALAASARSLLADWDETRRAIADAAAATESVLRIGVHAPVQQEVLADLGARLRAHGPGWRLTTVQAGWHDLTCGLASGTADVAIVWLPAADGQPYEHRVLATERRHVALPRSHPLAARSSLTFAEVRDEPFIALPEEAGPVRDLWLGADHRDGAPPAVSASAHSPGEALEAVAGRIGVALIGEAAAELHARSGVVTVPVTDLPPAELALMWSATDRREVIRGLVR
jgi:DNA-binding transcriptional LysR family regulator